MPPAVSIIVPVYNTAPWLARCLDSLCNQTLQDIEIICINDGSDDDCADILDAYAQRDSRIRLINFAQNKGVAVARNAGMRAAKGEWLGFIDSDDFVLHAFYNDLYTASIDSDADIVKGEIWGYDNENATVVPRNFYAINPKIGKNKAFFCYGFTSAIFRRSMLKESTIFFPEGLVTMEDPCFTIMAALKARRIDLVPTACYFYTLNAQSSTHGNVGPQVAATRKACTLIQDFLDRERPDTDSRHIIISFLKMQLNGMMEHPDISDTDRSLCQQYLDELPASPAALRLPEPAKKAHAAAAVEKLRAACRLKTLAREVQRELTALENGAPQ